MRRKKSEHQKGGGGGVDQTGPTTNQIIYKCAAESSLKFLNYIIMSLINKMLKNIQTKI